MDGIAGFYKYRPEACFEVTDEDAGDFLQSQFTSELRPFEFGRAAYGLWLELKGKVMGDAVILCTEAEAFLVVSESTEGSKLRSHLERHIIADDVVLEPVEERVVFELSEAACAKTQWVLPDLGHFLDMEYGKLYQAPAGVFGLVVASEAVGEALAAFLIKVGCVAWSASERGLRRIATGRPRVPDEIGPSDLPGEGELELDAISFTKGCYLGQEVVARMHNIGQARRRLYVLSGDGAPPNVPLAIMNADSKVVGELRTAYENSDRWQGVALLKRRYVEAGERLYADGETAVMQRALREVVSG